MTVYEQTAAAAAEICERAHLQPGSILVVGCSTSEVVGSKIGTNSSVETAGEIARALLDVTGSRGVFLAVQCCEHLNRAIITERTAVPGAEIVNVVPQPKAGGSVPAAAWKKMEKPALAVSIQADAAIDIGDTLVGMHIRPVAVPLRISTSHVGHANLVMAYSRLPYIGGARAVYTE
mgnify:CR=1 FL=1